jgi:multidrug efflux pump subunit AcrA (membrane-fusion protein)
MQGKTIPNALQVPASAVVRADNGGSIVMLVGSDGAARKREVQLGLHTSEKAQVLSGLAATDMVITQGGYGLDEGTKVKVGGAEDEDKGGKNTGEQK